MGINHTALTSELKAKPLPRLGWLILPNCSGCIGAAALALKALSHGIQFMAGNCLSGLSEPVRSILRANELEIFKRLAV